MNYHPKKRLPLIPIGLLLLTALCANVHAGHTTSDNQPLAQWTTPTVGFATILHSIDTRTCYDWLTSMHKGNALRMRNALMAQLWKVAWLSILGVISRKEIVFRYALLSKLAIDIVVQLVRNTKIATMLSHWPIGLALLHGYALLNLTSTPHPSWIEFYTIFVLTFGIYYVVQKCYKPLRKKIIGDQYQTGNGSYLFDVCLGVACTVGPGMLSEALVGLFYIAFPFVVLPLEYFGV